jgi:hypothetical protein
MKVTGDFVAARRNNRNLVPPPSVGVQSPVISCEIHAGLSGIILLSPAIRPSIIALSPSVAVRNVITTLVFF